MANEKHIKAYQDKLEDGTYTMRIGDEVPEGDVNLAYIHTPRLDNEENIAMVNTSHIPENVIPYEQRVSLVVPDHEGKLSYAELQKGLDSIKEKPPYSLFPTKDFNLTRQFKNNRITVEDALYYKFEIMYHYDSRIGQPNKVEKYTGDQIKLTDENGHPLSNQIKYDIYVMAMEENPHIYWVKVYLDKTTNELDTFKIRYNHIDNVTSNRDVQSAKTELELYRNQSNEIVAYGRSRQLVEGGKLRIINGNSAYEPTTREVFDSADANDEVYHLVENPTQDGYEVYVPQKAEVDPRQKRIFNYRIVAKYKDPTGVDQEVTTGYINDWLIHPNALLNHEKYEFTQDWKQLGIPYGESRLNVKDMIQIAQPIGTPTVPQEAVYEIQDAEGNLMYSTTDANDNPLVTSIIQESQNYFGAARGDGLSDDTWSNAKHPNAILKSLPIDHQVSVIAERQKTQWDYKFKVEGEGFIGVPTVYTGNWWVDANIGVYKNLSRSPINVANKTNWNTIGTSNVNDWAIKTGANGKSYLDLVKNPNDVNVAAFYQKNGPKGQNMNNAKDYEFSAKLKVEDSGDDDVVGIVFRVQGSKNYYMFAWERDALLSDDYYYSNDEYPTNVSTKPEMNEMNRILLGSGGCSAFRYDPNIQYSSPKTSNENFIFNDWNDYTEYGFGNNRKRIFKVSPRTSGSAYVGYKSAVSDRTGCSFTDITNKGYLYETEEGSKGWTQGKEYKITVVVTGDVFKVYISENPNSNDKGILVCEAKDSTYKSGSVGVSSISQQWVQWGDMTYNEMEVTTVSTNKHPVTFNSSEQVRTSEKRVTELLKEPIKQSGASNYEVFNYTAYSDYADIFLDIDENGYGYVWARTTNKSAGGTNIEPWYTGDNNLDVFGSGHVEYHEDGHFTITVNPEKLPTDKVPYFVEGFRWKEPVITKGENITIRLGDDRESVVVEASVPPITPLNKWTTIYPESIHKADGVIPIATLLEKDGIIEKLNIPKDIPIHEILLRIERGEATSTSAAVNQEHRVNYRFRLEDDGLVRYPVDQFKDQLGVNRLRLSNLYQEFFPVEFEIDYHVLVPKNKKTSMQSLFSRNSPGSVIIEPSPDAASWIIENGRLVDKANRTQFVAAYNQTHLATKEHATDFSFRTIGNDDDVVGVIFRVKDKNNFYMYIMEGDEINRSFGSRLSSVQPGPLHEWSLDRPADFSTFADYIAKGGWRVYHQRVYQVKNGQKKVVAEKSTIINSGHVLNWQNNIRVESSGKTTNLYFQTGTINEADWKRAYQIETEWSQGAFGVCNFSQNVEFIDITTSELISVQGKISNLNYTGRPSAIMAKNTRNFCDNDVKNSMKQNGFATTANYTPLSYSAKVTNGNGEVSISATGEGPIQVYSYIDPSKTIADVDLVAWTHYEDLEVAPVFAISANEDLKIELEKPQVEQSKLELENWYMRVKNGRFQKRLELPYYEPEERTPSIYETYPELKKYAPKNIDDVEEVILEYAIPEYSNQEFHDRPIKLVERETPIILNEHAIQTKHHPITLLSNDQISYVEVEAFRNNQARTLRIRDIDAAKGIVYLIDRIRDQDEVIIRYAYDEHWYTYRGFNKAEIETRHIPTEVPIQSQATLEVHVKGRKETIEIIEPAKKVVFGIIQGDFSLVNIYPNSEGIRNYRSLLPHQWDRNRDEFNIINNHIDLLITGRFRLGANETTGYPHESVYTDLKQYFFEKKRNGIYFVPRFFTEGTQKEAIANRTLNEFGLSVHYVGDYSSEDAQIEVNTTHPLFAEYEESGYPTEILGDSEFIITNSKITPVAWSDSTRQHVIGAVYEDGNQRVLFFVNDSLKIFRTNDGLKPFLDSFVYNVLGETEPTTITHVEEDVKIFGPITKKDNQIAITERYTEEFKSSILIDPSSVFGKEWDEFIDYYSQHELILTPTVSYQSSGAPVKTRTIGYSGDRKPIDSRNMRYMDSFLFETTFIVDPVLEHNVLSNYFFHLDLNPSPGHTHTINTDEFFKWIPIDTDLQSYEKEDVDSKELLVKPIHIYMRPIFIRDKENKIIEGTQGISSLRHTDQGHLFDEKDYKYDHSMFRLGKVILQANSDMQRDTTVLDTRTRGGGLDEALSRKIIEEVNKESLHHWDIGYFDGQAYQENGVIIIRLPKTILKSEENPQGFTETEVHAAIQKHKAYGVLPIVEYYDPETLRNDTLPDDLDKVNTEIHEI